MAEKRVLEMIDQYIRKLGKKLDVQQAVLFGSHARDQATPDSDIDLVIVSNDVQHMPFLQRLEFPSIQWPFNKAADIIGYTPEEFKRFATKSTRVRQARKEGIRLLPSQTS